MLGVGGGRLGVLKGGGSEIADVDFLFFFFLLATTTFVLAEDLGLLCSFIFRTFILWSFLMVSLDRSGPTLFPLLFSLFLHA